MKTLKKPTNPTKLKKNQNPTNKTKKQKVPNQANNKKEDTKAPNDLFAIGSLSLQASREAQWKANKTKRTLIRF